MEHRKIEHDSPLADLVMQSPKHFSFNLRLGVFCLLLVCFIAIDLLEVVVRHLSQSRVLSVAFHSYRLLYTVPMNFSPLAILMDCLVA